MVVLFALQRRHSRLALDRDAGYAEWDFRESALAGGSGVVDSSVYRQPGGDGMIQISVRCIQRHQRNIIIPGRCSR